MLLVRLVARQQPHVAAIHERIAQIPLVEIHGAVDRRNPHAIAVIAHALDDAAHHAPRMQHARRQVAESERSRVGSQPRLPSPAPALPPTSGGAKQNTSVLQIGFAPSPVPMMSRITPPTPVFAPPYGSSADG